MFCDGECMFSVAGYMFRIDERMFTVAKHRMYGDVISVLTLWCIFYFGMDEDCWCRAERIGGVAGVRRVWLLCEGAVQSCSEMCVKWEDVLVTP